MDKKHACWISKVSTFRIHMNNNNHAMNRNKLIKKNDGKITCCNNLYT